MKLKIVLMTFCLNCLGGSLLAKGKYGPAGCGFGSLIFGDGGIQTSAATTNGSSANQLFGISSGTSNCVADSAEMAQVKQEQFMLTNLANFQKEVAQGGGETLVAFAEVLGCQDHILSILTWTLQSNQKDIFSAPGALATLDVAKERLTLNRNIASSCTALM